MIQETFKIIEKSVQGIFILECPGFRVEARLKGKKKSIRESRDKYKVSRRHGPQTCSPCAGVLSKIVCVRIGVCAHKYKCHWRPEVLDPPGDRDTGSRKLPEVGAGTKCLVLRKSNMHP